MKARFTPEALEDLDAIQAYLEPLNPEAVSRVIEAIQRAVLMILEHPHIGRRTDALEVLEFIDPRYRYKLPYIITENGITVLRVCHPARIPIDDTTFLKS